MSNNFSIDVSPQIAAVLAAVGTVDTVVDLIRSADVPAIQTNIDANETKIDTIIAAVPQNVRGDLLNLNVTHNTTSWFDALNLSSTQGKLYGIMINLATGITQGSFQLTIDGITSNTLVITTINTNLSVYHDFFNLFPYTLLASSTVFQYFNIEFSDNLRIQIKLDTGAGNFSCRALYSVDSF